MQKEGFRDFITSLRVSQVCSSSIFLIWVIVKCTDSGQCGSKTRCYHFLVNKLSLCASVSLPVKRRKELRSVLDSCEHAKGFCISGDLRDRAPMALLQALVSKPVIKAVHIRTSQEKQP